MTPAVIRTYKYRLKDGRAKKTLAAHATACNQVWNWCSAQHRDLETRYKAGARSCKWPSHYDLAHECKGVGAMLGIHQQTVQAICRAFVESRKRLRHAPRFRSSFGTRRALGWIPFQPQSRHTSGNAVTYLGRKYRFFGSKRRPLPETAKGGAFVEDAAGRWSVCFQVELPGRVACQDGAVGIDLGLKALATLSNGEVVAAPRIYRRHEAALAVAQRAKNMRRVRAIHCKIKDCRSDFLHKVSTDLAARYALIAVGNVSAKQLARTRMAKSVLDAGWSTFRRMLTYKAAQYVEVDEKFTTQVCSSCGSLPPERPKGITDLGVREWKCSDCGETHDRDVNAARNILILGRGASPLAEESLGDSRIGTTPAAKDKP